MSQRKIIVLTPVKNEAWILDLFLRVSSQFADAIILADQFSTDNSREIAGKYPKVVLIENDDPTFSNDYRQALLLKTARSLYDGINIILAIDADEILSADSLKASEEWAKMQVAEVGSVFYFEKPELYGSPSRTIRRNNDYPMGFVDDGTIVHIAKKVHSIRVPLLEGHQKYNFEKLKFLHASYLRPEAQRAKYRFYSVKENLLGTSPWYRRRRRYRNPNHLLRWEPVTDSDPNWFEYPEQLEINFEEIDEEINSWHNDSVLEALTEKGSFYFWFDDIWDMDWKKYGKSKNINRTIIGPPFVLRWLLSLSDKFNK